MLYIIAYLLCGLIFLGVLVALEDNDTAYDMIPLGIFLSPLWGPWLAVILVATTIQWYRRR